MNKILFASAAMAAGCSLPLCAAAQTAPASPLAKDAPTAVEAIVVMAQRREENIQSVPIAITAISSAQLETSRIHDNYGLDSLTPGLTINRSSGYALTFLRGVGTPNIIAGDEASVATYVDGFYQGPSLSSLLPYDNVDHVEVLRGPQGTLYGRNATGGLIDLVTPTPRTSFFAKASVGYDNYDTFETDDYVTGPLSDNIRADLSVRYRDQGRGVALNAVTGNRVGVDDGLSLRSKALFDITSTTRLTLAADYADYNNSLGNTLYVMPGTVPLASLIGGKSTTKPFVLYNNADPTFKVKAYGLTAKLQSDLGAVSFVSMSQYRHAEATQIIDVDGTSADNVGFLVQPGVGGFGLPTATYGVDQKIPYFATQEFQLLSNGKGPFTWIVGAFGQDSREGYDPFNAILNATTGASAGTVIAFETTKAYAAYAQGTYAFDSGLSLTAGGRYSNEQKHTEGSSLAQGVLTTDNKQATFHAFTYRLGVDYKMSPDLFLYALTSKGFKSGTFNTTSIDNNPAVLPETLYDYEVGFKADPIDTLRINGAAYYYDYKNIQYAVGSATNFAILENAAEGTLYGVELSVEYHPIQGLALFGALALEHSRYDSFHNAQVYVPAPVAGQKQAFLDATGKQMMRTPEATGNVGAAYDFALPHEAGTLSASGNVYYNSGYPFDPVGGVKQSSYSTFDGALTWKHPDGLWSVAAWGKNLTAEHYFSQVTIGGRGSRVGYAPRMFGLTLRYQTQ
jgi:iron complex outermembrane receptor protein